MMNSSTPAIRATRRSSRKTGRAAIVTAPRQIEVREVAFLKPQAGEVRVRVSHCGVCASNVPPFEGRPWFVYPFAPGALGHEALGMVESVGEGVSQWQRGDRVAYLGERGYAEFETVAASSLFALPNTPDDEVFLAEPLACAANVFRRAGIRAGDLVGIVGVGFLGMLLTQLAGHAGARVMAFGRRRWILKQAERFGAQSMLCDDNGETVQKLLDQNGGRLCDVVIEATGHQEPLELAAQLARVRGRLVIAGYHQDGLRQVNLQLWNWRGLDVINAHERDPAVYFEGMQLAHEAMMNGRLTTRGLITHRFPLEELGTALNLAATRPDGFLKAVIEL